jgi:hypothetical protein
MRTGTFTAALAGLGLIFAICAPAAAANPSCGEVTYHGPSGVEYQVLFAKNGAVQAYHLVRSSDNPELDHDQQRLLVARYGPEGDGAPPLKILSYKPGEGGGLLVPDKAVDSCGRISYFH